MRYGSKEDLLADIERERDALRRLLAEIPEDRWPPWLGSAQSSPRRRARPGLARALSEAELLEPGHFSWTGTNTVVTYPGANTASRYRFARRVLRRWMRGNAGGRGERSA